ncbi:MAG: histone deacetylase [Chloroflexi bacterium]|nr:histone deacetylase [Chloroflexota bacterium]
MATAYATDERFDIHTLEGHPEFAGRLTAIQQRLDEDNLIGRLLHIEPQPATMDELGAVHTSRYLELLAKTSGLTKTIMWGADTYITPRSYETARLAAGAVLRVVDMVMNGQAANGLAAVRPPGHHATPSDAMGFCLLNNIAIAARYAQRVYGIKRVLIVDYDVHHGNGTQEAFYADPTVFYISTHQWPLYPGTGSARDVGVGDGTGSTLNMPLPAGVGDEGYTRVFDEVVLPTIHRFAPELILVSAGFDAHWDDPLANMRLSLSGYDHLARRLLAEAVSCCAGRIVFVLEGGYNLNALSHGWANVVRMLLGDTQPVDPLGVEHGVEPLLDPLVQQIKHLHKLA